MQANATTKTRSFWMRHRMSIILVSMLLFLPPLAVVFQASGDTNFCGAWCPRMFFVWRKGMTGSEFLAGFARSYLGVGLVLGMLVSTFFLGRHWCSHLCPIGGSTEAVSRLVPEFLKINFSSVPAAPFRYGYLSVYLIASAVGIGSLCCNYCNFAAVPRLFGAAFLPADMAYFLRTAGLINLGLVLLLGFFAKGGRAYCNFLCPIGALDALASRIGARFGRRVNVSASKCDGCGACGRVCPVWAIENEGTAVIDHLSCMPCRECEKVCPREAINYGRAEA